MRIWEKFNQINYDSVLFKVECVIEADDCDPRLEFKLDMYSTCPQNGQLLVWYMYQYTWYIETFLNLNKWFLWLFRLRDNLYLSACLSVQVFAKSGAEQHLVRRALYLKQSLEAALQKHKELHIDYKSRVRRVVSPEQFSKVFKLLWTTFSSKSTQRYTCNV